MGDGWWLFQIAKERTSARLRRNFGLTLFMAEEPLTEEIASRLQWMASHAIAR
jgi:hypothetical protein